MKILAVNSSPRAGAGSSTEILLNHLVQGMREAGADVYTVNLKEKIIRQCLGCFTCWTSTLGRCIQLDDMTNELLPRFLTSDLVVYATPLYYQTMNSRMSIFRERMLLILQPFVEKRDGKTAFRMRHKTPPAVWLSVAGLPEQSEFGAFSTFLHSTLHPDESIVAEIYRTSSEAMKHPAFQKTLNDILDAVTEAGRELVQSLKISPGVMERIRQPIVEAENAVRLTNLMWKTCITEKVTLREFFEKGIMPRPDSLETFMAVSLRGLNAEAAGGKKVILQYTFSGEVEGSCHFIFKNGAIQAKTGVAGAPDIAIETPFELWMDIMTGKAGGREMFIQGKYRVHGDISLMLQLFSREDH